MIGLRLYRSFAIGLVGNKALTEIEKTGAGVVPILCDRISWKRGVQLPDVPIELSCTDPLRSD